MPVELAEVLAAVVAAVQVVLVPRALAMAVQVALVSQVRSLDHRSVMAVAVAAVRMELRELVHAVAQMELAEIQLHLMQHQD
jgi:hypothetical protein